MSHSIIQQKSFEFAVQIVHLYSKLIDKHEYVMSRQLLRCGTSIGANVEEALGGQSRSDFIAKMCIARKEARETIYWLRLFQTTEVVSIDVSPELLKVEELLRILTSLIKSARANNS